MDTNYFNAQRSELLSFIRKQLVGPHKSEDELLKDSPQKRYLSGILYPVAATKVADDEQESQSDEDALKSDFKPSSMALSFAVKKGTSLKIELSAGRYTAGQTIEWRRKALSFCQTYPVNEQGKIEEKVWDDNAALILKKRRHGDDFIVTIALTNRHTGTEKLEVGYCLFQAGIKISVVEGAVLKYPDSARFRNDEEHAELSLIYRNRVTWAVGHGVSANWISEGNASPETLFSEHLPAYEIQPLTADFSDEDLEKWEISADVLNLHKLAFPAYRSDEDVITSLETLANGYSYWIEELEHRILPKQHDTARANIFSRLKKASERLFSGIEKLGRNRNAMFAFRMANRAMLMQMIHSDEKITSVSRDADGLFITPDYTAAQFKDKYRWRPFQLAYQLIVLESMIPDENGELPESHDEADLLWFPTGGGKTEAYLAVAAWEIISRRILHGTRGGGTAVIKRYTLRLLTSQQFERAGTLICALESLRKEDPERLGEEPVTLGFWAGGNTSPNKYKAAVQQFETLRNENEPDNPFQLRSCPWCSKPVIPRYFSDNNEDYGIRSTTTSFEFYCPDKGCDFHESLPVSVIDEQLYSQPPTLLIATTDKFAQLAWIAEAHNLIAPEHTLPPSLIIQDELHLISGPLGTIASVYESGIDTAISMAGKRPKVLAATATIRNAPYQVNRLFGRKVNIFPPTGIEDDDSFFSKSDTTGPGRMYLGVMPSGHTGQTSMVQSAAAILQAPVSLGMQDTVLDSYWTLPVYHNSRRELGKTMTLARDDIPARIKVIATDEQDVRDITRVEELSANVKGPKIPELLKNLAKPQCSGEAVDILPCTNMISVGVDISRLNTMIVVGQPKSSAEYIQASSRVGRSSKYPPGLVVTLYSPNKPRDISHYETFRSYHQALYRHVEATSVTPWTEPAMERALHAALIIAIRAAAGLRDTGSAKHFRKDNEDIKRVTDALKERMQNAMEGLTGKEQKDVFLFLDNLIDEWHGKAESGDISRYESRKAGKQYQPLIKSFDAKSDDKGWATLNSMRNVDSETLINVKGEKR